MSISVLVPSYRRPDDLERCLRATGRQRRAADEIVVVLREEDTESRALVRNLQRLIPQLRTVFVCAPGVIAALNAGLSNVRSDLVAITDDDAVPRPDWLARIVRHFKSEARVGAVGGRDYVVHLEGAEWKHRVGELQWFGRVIGNHHVGCGPAREVEVLKGVNISFRTAAVAEFGFDNRLWGQGAQVHWELAICLALKRAGWKLIYDPEITVDHYPAVRFDRDQRGSFNFQAQVDQVHNETLILLEYFTGFQRTVYLLWAVLVGTSSSFGIVQGLRFLPHGRGAAFSKCVASLKGRWLGFKSWLAYR